MRCAIVLLILFIAYGTTIATPEALAQASERAYAPEDLRSLSRADQTRVIRKEYSEQSGGRSLPDDQLTFYLDQVSRSNWKFSDIKRDIATSLSAARPPAKPSSASVICGSENYRYRECHTGFPGRAALAQNLSNTRCVEGENWGSRAGVVWVDKGCQARFSAVAFVAGKLVCESQHGRDNTCRTGFTDRVRLTRQLSSTRCMENQNWGQHPGTVWVRNGCRAEFTRITEGSRPPATGSGYSVTCVSDRNHDRTCEWDSKRGRPAMIQQLSSASCVAGQTWRYEAGRIWVMQGCGARFGVSAQAAVPGYSIECTSARLGTTTWCEWEARRGKPVLAQDHSARRCVEGHTWGHVPARGIWVTDGCNARFAPAR